MNKIFFRITTLLLIFISAAGFTKENPSTILFIEMTGKNAAKHAETYSKINEKLKKIIEYDFSDKIKIIFRKNDIQRIDEKHAFELGHKTAPQSRLILFGSIRPLWGQYRTTINLIDRDGDPFSMSVTFDKNGLITKADEFPDLEYIIARANNFFLEEKPAQTTGQIDQRSVAVLDFHIAPYIESKEFKNAEKKIISLIQKKSKGLLRIPSEEKFKYILKDSGRNFNSDERLLSAGRILSCRWIVYGMVCMDEKKYSQYLYLYNTRSKSTELVIKTESQNRKNFFKEAESRLDEFMLKISEKGNYFLHKNPDIGFVMDIDNFGTRTNQASISPSGMTLNNNGNLLTACWMDAVILSKHGKLIDYIGESGSGQGKFQGAYRAGSDSKNNFYILDSASQKVIIYSGNKPQKEFRINESYPQSFAVSNNGFCFVPDQTTNTLRIYNQSGRVSESLKFEGMKLTGVNSTQKGIASLWAFNTGAGYLIAFHGGKGKIVHKHKIPLQNHLLNIWKFTVDKESRIYAFDNARKTIFRISPNNEIEFVLNRIEMNNRKNFGNIADIAVNSRGDSIYLRENPGKRIIKLREFKKTFKENLAIIDINEAIKYKKNDTDIYLFLINRVLNKFPENKEALILKADFFAKQNHYIKAISLYQRALEKDPSDLKLKNAINDSKIMLHLTNARLFRKRFIKTLEEIGPETAKKDYSLAIAEYEKLIKISPERKDIRKEFEALSKRYTTSIEQDKKTNIEISGLSLQNIFSAMYKYYADNSIGTVTVKNISKNKIERLYAEIFIKKYMDYSTESRVYKEIGSGEQRRISLNAVFNNRILGITEDSPFSFIIKIKYRIKGREYTSETTGRTTVFNRNALTWETTEKLASFITPKDTSVKIFARETVQHFRHRKLRFINNEFQYAMQIFHCLGIYGITYVPDPKTPYKQFSRQKVETDFVQYPRETLRFKTGDCDDLTAMYCSLLENIGIETAMVTVPGHIFMMFNTGTPFAQKHEISSTDSLTIQHRGSIWIPVEITNIGESFLEAWEKGSRHFMKYKPEDIEIVTTRDSWHRYAPVTLDETGWEPSLPQSGPVERLYFKDINNFIDSEISAKTREINFKLKKGRTPSLLNRAGIVYAKYGKYEKAAGLFNQSVKINNRHFPSLFNLGNISLIKKEYHKALQYYKKAASIKPKTAHININLSIVYARLNDFKKAEKFYRIAVSINPSMKKLNPLNVQDNNRAGNDESSEIFYWVKTEQE